MKKLITIICILFCLKSSAQVYQLMPQYGYQAPRMAFDSTLQIPTFCGVPTLKSVQFVTKKAAIAFDSCNNRFYQYNPKTLAWSVVSGGGGSTDTTSLSNRINLKIDSIKRRRDSVFAYRNGTEVFQFKDSVGASGSTPTLNQVLAAGSIGTNKDIALQNSTTFNQINLVNNTTASSISVSSAIPVNNGIYLYARKLSGGEYPHIEFLKNDYVLPQINQELKGGNSTGVVNMPFSPNATDTLATLFNLRNSGGGGSTDTTSLSNRINQAFTNVTKISDTSFFMSSPSGTNDTIKLNSSPVYVESPIMARVSGDSNIIFFNSDTANAWRGGGGGVAVDTIFRTLGKDSIFYKKNNITYSIKDSVGTNPPPNGYYGAFQDNTTQTALDVNVATAVKFNTTDLSNGVTIVNDGSSNPTRVTIANAGVYNIQFSLQLEKISGSGNYVIDIWLRKNGTNVAGTTGKIVLTGSANASPVVAAWNYVLQLASNDYVQIMWSTSNTNAVIISESASSPYPSVPSSILTITQQSGIMAGTGISPLDTANMLLPYLRKADTTVFQRKQIAANSIQGNNTSAAANATNIFFKDTSGTYTGTITWGGTAPTSLTATYRWVRIGRRVDLNITLVYANAGTTNTTLLLTMPSDAPTPAEPSGATSNSNYLYPTYSIVNTNLTTLTNSQTRGGIRKNSGGSGYEMFINFTSLAASTAYVTATYFTN